MDIIDSVVSAILSHIGLIWSKSLFFKGLVNAVRLPAFYLDLFLIFSFS